MASPSASTSGTVPAATTPSPSGSATDSSRRRSRLRCPRNSSSVPQTGVFVSTSERCSSRANSLAVELCKQRVDFRGGPARLQVDDVELLLDAEQGDVTHGQNAATTM